MAIHHGGQGGRARGGVLAAVAQWDVSRQPFLLGAVDRLLHLRAKAVQMSVFNRLHPDRVTPIDQSRVYQVDDEGTSHAAPTLLPTINADGLPVVPMSQAQLWEFDLRGWICLPGLLSAEQVAAVREHQLRLMPEPESLPEKERDHHGGPENPQNRGYWRSRPARFARAITGA